MLREAQLEHLEHLIDAYATIRAYLGREEELASKIEQVFVEMASREADFDSVVSILGTHIDYPRLIPSRGAWVLQHAFNCRAYCVKNHIIQVREEAGKKVFESPILDQSKLQNLGARDIDLRSVYERRETMGCRKTIDAILVDSEASRIYPAMVIPLSSSNAKTLGSSANPKQPGLFTPPNRELISGLVQGRTLAALMLTSDMMSSALPHFQVDPLVVIMDDTEGSWGFQAHLLSGVAEVFAKDRRVELDNFEVVASSLLWRKMGRDLDELQQVPFWATRDRLFNLPIDRAARCYMVLRILWDKQRSSSGLIGSTLANIGDAVQSQYGIAFTMDLRRHDIEDCLERAGYVARLTYDRSKFAITPRGVSRIVLMQRLLADITPADTDNGMAMNILGIIHDQSLKWSEYREGISK